MTQMWRSLKQVNSNLQYNEHFYYVIYGLNPAAAAPDDPSGGEIVATAAGGDTPDSGGGAVGGAPGGSGGAGGGAPDGVAWYSGARGRGKEHLVHTVCICT